MACAAALLSVATTAGAGDDGGALIGGIYVKSQEALPFLPVVAETSRVQWAKTKIKVDGDLADWIDVPVMKKLEGGANASWLLGEYGGSEDLNASLRMCRDDNYIYIAVVARDDAAPAPSRVEFAITKWDMHPITGWQDVGRRYGVDDLHAMFDIHADGTTVMHWGHIQERRERAAINPAFGDRASQRLYVSKQLDGEFIPRGPADAASLGIVSAARHGTVGTGITETVFEVALPWKLLLPYSPVSYMPIKFNFAVHDSDGVEETLAQGAVAWKPGLVGTYSGVHFATLEFAKPEGRHGIDSFAQVAKHRFVDEEIAAEFSFLNHGRQAVEGKLEFFAEGAIGAFASKDVELPPGPSSASLSVHSENIADQDGRVFGRFVSETGIEVKIPIYAPSSNGEMTIYPLAQIQAAIAQLEVDAATLSNLYQQAKSRGLDTAYPLAYLSLHRIFIARSKGDMRGDPQRAIENMSHLREIFPAHKAYIDKILLDPAAQKRVPPRFKPEELEIRDGYYTVDGKPVFLWGPCTFWYMRADQHYVWEMGFNSVGPELPYGDLKNRPEIERYLEAYRANGVMVNAAIGSSYFEELKKEHPDIANLDANNFMPVIIQHPIVREEIERRIEDSIAFYRNFPGVRSYWLWNEPEYVNTSEVTRRDFINQYLKTKYGSVGKLNKRWRSNWTDFNAITLPEYDPANQAPWYDFQCFRDDLLANFFAFLNNISKRLDESRPTHVKFMCLSCELFDSERFQSIFDIAGHDGNMSDRDVQILDLWKSLYAERPLVNTEIHTWYRDYTLVSLLPWRLALHGLADGNWWCWHSNSRFSNSNSSSQSMHGLSIAGLDVQRLFDPYIVALNRKPTHIATLFPDVINARSAVPMERLRHEIAPAQYTLGVLPHYVTEKTAAAGALDGNELLLACESSFVKDSTYNAVIDYVKNGGAAIVEKGGFAQNEYGDPRDVSELFPNNESGESEQLGRHASIGYLGKGRVIRIGKTKAQDRDDRQAIYREVFADAIEELGLNEPVRLVAADGSHKSMRAMEWRVAEVDGGHVLAVLPYEGQEIEPGAFLLETARPVLRITDLITGGDVPVDGFQVGKGPNLFLIELDLPGTGT